MKPRVIAFVDDATLEDALELHAVMADEPPRIEWHGANDLREVRHYFVHCVGTRKVASYSLNLRKV